jgi:hypothetical protein
MGCRLSYTEAEVQSKAEPVGKLSLSINLSTYGSLGKLSREAVSINLSTYWIEAEPVYQLINAGKFELKLEPVYQLINLSQMRAGKLGGS